MKKKAFALFLALALVVGGVVGGTVAWLTATSDTVTNTFTVGDVAITLDEAKVDENGVAVTPAERVTNNSYKLIPGTVYTKDPTVTVTAGSENCYLFVKFEEIGNAPTYITYRSTLTAANGWTQGDGTTIPANVWYREVNKADTTRSWNLLVDDQIVIKADAVTKDTMTAASGAKLQYTAYAVQKANIDSAAAAWEVLFPTTTP